jgi:phytoene synthase
MTTRHLSTPLGAGADDIEVVQRLVRKSGTSFYRGMAILPPDRRTAMYAIYAFCRLVDDIADEPAPMNLKAQQLDAWRFRIEEIFHGHAPVPEVEGDDAAVARVLLLATNIFALRRADFLAIIDGMQMDAETIIVAPAFDTLDLYCDRVASAVGRLSVRAFGDASPAADEVAHHLGRALQLTNILRDLGEDAWRGRLYLPREWLAVDGVPTEAAAALASPNLKLVCEHAVREARSHFNHARTAMQRCDRRAMKPARLMAATYAAILDRLEQRGWDKPDERVSVPKWEKLVIALRYALG